MNLFEREREMSYTFSQVDRLWLLYLLLVLLLLLFATWTATANSNDELIFIYKAIPITLISLTHHHTTTSTTTSNDYNDVDDFSNINNQLLLQLNCYVHDYKLTQKLVCECVATVGLVVIAQAQGD